MGINAEETVAEVDEERRGSLDVAEDKKNGGVANRASGGDGKGEQLDNSENSADSNELSPPKVEVLPLHRMRTRTISRAVYETHDGAPLDKTIVDNIKQFQVGKKKGFIDVWWMYDDGGLTLLIPYILSTRQMYSECSLRVFTLGNRKDDLDRETRNMAALLAKFRIDFSDVVVIPDVTKRAKDETRTEFNSIIDSLPEGSISEEDRQSNKEKTNRHLRLAELLREHSKESQLVVMTLPMPRKGSVRAALYMSWLEIMTRDLPPTLLIRGNQTSVLTFYS